MQCEDKVETEHSLAKVHKVCRLIGIIVKIIFVVFVFVGFQPFY